MSEKETTSQPKPETRPAREDYEIRPAQPEKVETR